MTYTDPTSTKQLANCPECGTKGKRVQRVTLESLLGSEAVSLIGSEQYRYCDSVDCNTVYFGDSGMVFSKNDLNVRIGVKEKTSPRHVCYCFDHTIEEIDSEVQETGNTTVIDDIKSRMKSGCFCETKNPQGSCCLGTVGKYVKQALIKHGQSESAKSFDRAINDCCTSTDTESTEKNEHQRTGMIAAGGAVLTALAASACCWIPLLLIALGMSVGGVSAWFDQYRWLFLTLTGIFLSLGFYFVYFRTPKCKPGSACSTPNLKLVRFNRVMLWIATLVVITTAAFPKYAGYLISQDAPTQITLLPDEVTTVTLGIDGMTCDVCAVHVQNALLNVPGILDAEVSHTDGNAIITFANTNPPSSIALTNAVKNAGYTVDASLLADGTP